MPRSRHRTGAKYRAARAEMFRIYGHTCHICGHGGARTADHLVPVSHDPDQPIDPHDMRPAHGSGGLTRNPCPTCKRNCNQERGTRPLSTLFKPVIEW